MRLSTSQILRWTFLGSAVGVLIGSPFLWIIASPFDRSIHSLDKTLFACALAYAYGVPPAFVTGAVYQWLNPKMVKLRIRRVWILPIAAISSTYLAWVIAIAELVDGKFDLTGAVAIAGWLGTMGVLAAAVMLWTDRRITESDIQRGL